MPRPTNILLITSDQQHWNTLSCIGSQVRTPNHDRLAATGTLFRRGYCPNPTCTPTRASIITGLYPSQHGAYSLGTKLSESVPTVGDAFQTAGYRTALVGKARLLEGYAQRAEPFFLWSSFFDPHPKYLAPRPWDAMYDPQELTVPAIVAGEHDRNPPHFQMTQTEQPDFSAWNISGKGIHGCGSHLHDRDELARDIACYYGMISLMDKQIGLILDRLEALGLADSTLVVFSSDHGHFYGHHGLTAKGPFHYEDLIRVPLIVNQPDAVPAGRESDSLQSLVDFAPTFLSACGIAVPAAMTGIDQSSVWRGERETLRDHVVVENHHEPGSIHVKTYVDERHKLTVYHNQEYGELFDLESDPTEINNLWDQPGAQELKARLFRRLLFAEMGKEPVPMRPAGA